MKDSPDTPGQINSLIQKFDFERLSSLVELYSQEKSYQFVFEKMEMLKDLERSEEVQDNMMHVLEGLGLIHQDPRRETTEIFKAGFSGKVLNKSTGESGLSLEVAPISEEQFSIKIRL